MESTNENVAPKERNGIVTAWLLLMLLGNLFVALVYLVGGDGRPFLAPEETPYILFILLGALSIANAYFAILMVGWKKSGFRGFVITTMIALIVNISIGVPVGRALIGLFGIAILYIILQFPKNNVSAWENLE
jgi:hypothetical protein